MREVVKGKADFAWMEEVCMEEVLIEKIWFDLKSIQQRTRDGCCQGKKWLGGVMQTQKSLLGRFISQ